MSDWQQSQFPGVRFREHPTRKFNGKPDMYYTVRFRVDGKRKEESLGWASEGWTPAKANAEMVNRMQCSAIVSKPDVPPQSTVEQKPPANLPLTQQSIPKFQYAAELFIEWAKANKKTWADDEQRLKKHVLPVLGQQKLIDVGFPEVELLKLNCQNNGLAPATVVPVYGFGCQGGPNENIEVGQFRVANSRGGVPPLLYGNSTLEFHAAFHHSELTRL